MNRCEKRNWKLEHLLNTGKTEIQPDFNTAGTLDETPKNRISAGPKKIFTAGATRPKTLKLPENFSKFLKNKSKFKKYRKSVFSMACGARTNDLIIFQNFSMYYN